MKYNISKPLQENFANVEQLNFEKNQKGRNTSFLRIYATIWIIYPI